MLDPICCDSMSRVTGQPVVQPHLHVFRLHGLHLGRQGRHGGDSGPICCNYLVRVLTPCVVQSILIFWDAAHSDLHS